ncbi:hypothetical protein ACFL4H_00120 [Candidatus Neomarinimicrobiota bacterium]
MDVQKRAEKWLKAHKVIEKFNTNKKISMIEVLVYDLATMLSLYKTVVDEITPKLDGVVEDMKQKSDELQEIIDKNAKVRNPKRPEKT